MIDLNTLIPPNSGLQLVVGYFISDSRRNCRPGSAPRVVTGMDGTLMWLKDAFPSNGRRIGGGQQAADDIADQHRPED
jgi:hypothetical protein